VKQAKRLLFILLNIGIPFRTLPKEAT